MSVRASSAIFRHEMRVLLTDPSTVVFVIFMPLLMVALTKQLFASSLQSQGYPDANGAEFGVPGMAVAFAAFGVGYSGFSFFRDHGWGTWERLRATPASSVDIMVGKVVPMVLVTIAQLGVLFGLGGPLFGMRVKGSWIALWLLILVLALALSAAGMVVTALARSMNQLNAIGSVGGTALALLGGAWVPVEAMPDWAQAIAPGLPTYWAMDGFRGVILDGTGLVDALLPAAVIAGFGVLFTGLAAWRFRFDEAKAYFG